MIRRLTPAGVFLITFTITLLIAWAFLVWASTKDVGTCIGAAVLGLDGAHTTYPIECGP